MECCFCGKKIRENDDKAIVNVPFAGEIVSFCSEKCMDGVTKE